MITKKTLGTGLLALCVGVTGFGAGLATQGVSAASETPAEFYRPPFFEEVDREVTLLDNGVQIEITSDVADVVEHIQNFHNGEHNKGPKDEEVDFSVEMTDNGVIVTITSENAEKVEKIQDRSENPKPHGPRGKQCEPGEEESED